MSENTVTVRGRVRIQGRLKDPDGKWRDEITQELEVTSTVGLLVPDEGIDKMARMLVKIEKELFENLAAAGGMSYTARQFPESSDRVEPMRCPQGVPLEEAGNALFCETTGGSGDGSEPCEQCLSILSPSSEEPVGYQCQWPGWMEPKEVS